MHRPIAVRKACRLTCFLDTIRRSFFGVVDTAQYASLLGSLFEPCPDQLRVRVRLRLVVVHNSDVSVLLAVKLFGIERD